MESGEIRRRFLAFFEKRGHHVVPSSSLVPENDPTTLFTGSGMQPLIPYLLGALHPKGSQLANSQKSFRAQDIAEVGDNRHTTFFEMLGNWSLGAYFKEEQLQWFFQFLTEEVGISKDRLWVTCFDGDTKLNLPRDSESAEIWKRLGIPEERIRFYGSENNWWSRAGAPLNMPAGEPGGPDSEVFYEFVNVPHDTAYSDTCHPNCNCGRFMEIGNSVFMEYIKKDDGSFATLKQRNVDFGGGLERITAAKNDNPDIFMVDTLQGMISQTQIFLKSEKRYSDDEWKKAFRIIADHFRSAVFLVADGVRPSNTEQGYVLRRLLRRAIYYSDLLGVVEGKLNHYVEVVAETYKDHYPELSKNKTEISAVFDEEEAKFRRTLTQGLKEFEKSALKGEIISGHDAFILFSTYGLPLEMTIELAQKKGKDIDVSGFKKEFEKHQELSRAGAEKKFKGGLADTSEMSVKYHTATHLLHQALRDVLGNHVFQKGSNITPERLRFDFNFEKKMTDEEKKRVEDIVNERIREALPVSYEDIPLEEAEKRGAIGLFEEKYNDKVRVYKIGDFSLEFCGGPHVQNTSELGTFKIIKEEAISAGVRRIKAVLE